MNPLNLTMNRPYAVTANFAEDIGSVSVTITPAGAVTAGARWHMTSGPDMAWHTSGSVIAGISATGAPYTVNFNAVAGWTEPPDITGVGIVNGGTSSFSRAYVMGDMAFIAGGTFQMGVNPDGHGGHVVTVSDFYLDRRELTQGDFQAFCAAVGRTMPSQPVSNAALPVVRVTWQDATDYAAWAGKRLPTDAEYEFAMRGGAAYYVAYPWGNAVSAGDANYDFNVPGLRVGASYPATGPGLYDIAGNAWEWCRDWHGDVLTGPVVDPQGPSSGTQRVIRGGSWASAELTLRCYTRYSLEPGVRYGDLGFRCAKSAGSGSGGPAADVNGNGIPDWWEIWYFGSTSGFNASDDSDGDGMINWQEFVAGTSPTNSGSLLKVTSAGAPAPTNGYVIVWPSVQGRLYTIERSVALPTFTPLATDIVATPLKNSYTDVVGGGGPYFYRVRVQP